MYDVRLQGSPGGRLALSAAQLRSLEELVERDGWLRIVVLSQNFAEALRVLIGGRQYLVYADGGIEQLEVRV